LRLTLLLLVVPTKEDYEDATEDMFRFTADNIPKCLWWELF